MVLAWLSECGLTTCCFPLVYSAEPKAALGGDVDAVDTGISKEMASGVALTSQILTALKEKPAPELSLSSQDLEVGKN